MDKGIMPEFGEIRTPKELNRKGTHKFIYVVCPICGKGRWVQLIRGKPEYTLCRNCMFKKQKYAGGPNWRGGRIKHSLGYVRVLLQKDDFFYPMADKQGYVVEHRLIMAKYLNRHLLPQEIPHHKNGIKNDNRLENLLLLANQSEHMREHTRQL